MYDVSQKCEASDLLLLTIQEFDYFKGCVDSFIGLGSYHRDVRDLARRKYPATGWIDDRAISIIGDTVKWFYDAPIVTRCGQCKYSAEASAQTKRYGHPGTMLCENRFSPCNHRYVNVLDFCSYAERKEKEEDGKSE